MKFIRVEGTTELENALIGALNGELAQNKLVLWLVPGGSNIDVAVRVMARLTASDFTRLTIVLTDERFGPSGHKDSNYFQLMQKGFDTRGAIFIDLLKGDTLQDTLHNSGTAMEKIFTYADSIIGFFGMGSDGHIAGILPHSPAAIPDESWMVGYDAGEFKRMTLTPFALSHIQKAYAGAFGDEKLEALENLKSKLLPIIDQPAQILRHLPEAYIYNNQIGD